MTYLQFLALFILPPLAVLALLVRRTPVRRLGLTAAALPLIALVYTTPWDNYLVASGVWDYGAARVIGTIGYVPVEEYLFMVLQSLLVLAWLVRCRLHNAAPARPAGAAGARSGAAVRIGGAASWVLVALLGALLLGRDSTRYLGLILAWAAPVLAAQWWFTGDVIVHRARQYAVVVAAPVLYLWIADAIAIHLGTWRISERYTVGMEFFGLPVEEMTFFLVTTLLSVHGALLLLEPWRLGLRRYAPAAAPAAALSSER